MEHHLDHKVILGTEPEHKSLYSWFLREVGENVSKYANDQIPWTWTLYFMLSEVTLVTGSHFENECDNDSTKITQKEHISAKLTPGYIKNGSFHREANYSMFGTNRYISSFDLQIVPETNEEKQGCSAWGCTSYTCEIDFREDTEPDILSFYLTVGTESFNRYSQQIREKSVTSALFRVGKVAGFYSEWSPSISTSNIKVLTPDLKNHPIESPAGCEVVPPRLGFVGEAELLFCTAQEFKLPSLEGFDDNFDDNLENDMLQEEAIEPMLSSGACSSVAVIAVLKSLRFAAWLIASLLFLILISK